VQIVPATVRQLIDVLVVDDNEDVRSALVDILEYRNYTVAEARNGRDALAQLEWFAPRLVLMDLMMPIMDGWSCFASLREDSRHALIPVIFLSAVAESAPSTAAGIITKPFTMETIVSAVQRFHGGPAAAPTRKASAH
jgi:CheY-like chemotaxis protein